MVLFGLPQWIALCFLFVFGSVVGSFLNVCIHRIPLHDDFWKSLKGVVHPPSRCPNCFHRIQSYDNIPIFGWLLLGGRCRNCRSPISWRYPAIELLNGLLWVLLYWFEVPAGFAATIQNSCVFDDLGPQGFVGSAWLSPMAVVHWRFFYHLALIEALLVATFIDFDLRIIPDGVTIPAMALGVLGGWAIGQVNLVPLWMQRDDLGPMVAMALRMFDLPIPAWLPTQIRIPAGSAPFVPAWIAHYPHTHGLLASLAGLFVGGGLVCGVRWIGFWVLRQEAMGFGDVVLLAAIGSFLGWQPVIIVFFLAPACALVVVAVSWIIWRQREIPYGPYLSLATLIVILGWKPIWFKAERIFEMGPLLPVIALVMTGMLLLSLQTVQWVKRLLGIELYPPEWTAEWTSGDQLAYLAGEKADTAHGSWPGEHWSGADTSGGRLYVQLWRQGPERHSGASWQAWQRRNHRT